MDEPSQSHEASLPPDAESTANAASPVPPLVYPDARRAAAPPTAWLVAGAAWFIPGLGHLVLGRWGRAAAIFLCVAAMAIAGYQLQGQVFSIRSDDIFGILGHFADLGAGAFYLFSRFLEPAGANLALASADVGTRLLAIAGLLNFLCVADAFEIARRAKS